MNDDRALIFTDKQGYIVGWNAYINKSKDTKKSEIMSKIFEVSNKKGVT